MKLYGTVTSPFVRHCRVALMQCRLDWEFVTGDMDSLAAQSPVHKVPYLSDGDRVLGDSCSIIKYARESAGEEFLPDIDEYDLFCTTNTILDAAANVFQLGKDGLTPEHSPYLGRQAQRVESGLQALDGRVGTGNYALSDGILRVACFLDWGLFRNRIDIEPYDNLRAVLDFANEDPVFTSTSIPEDMR